MNYFSIKQWLMTRFRGQNPISCPCWTGTLEAGLISEFYILHFSMKFYQNRTTLHWLYFMITMNERGVSVKLEVQGSAGFTTLGWFQMKEKIAHFIFFLNQTSILRLECISGSQAWIHGLQTRQDLILLNFTSWT